MSAFVSIIIPTYNSERTIEKCLQSILNQSYKDIELIVVDNSSRDNTVAIAKKYTEKVFTKGPERSAQRNFGASQAKGKYLLIHDSDIYFHVGTIKECVELLENDSEAGGVIIPETTIGTGFWAKFKAYERSFYVGLDLIESSRFFRKEVFEKVGGYDENLNACEDWDLEIRLKKITKIIRAKNFVEHDEGEINPFKTKQKKNYYRQYFEIYRQKHPAEYRKQINPFYRYRLSKVIRDLFVRPHLLFGMIVMRFIETGVFSFISRKY